MGDPLPGPDVAARVPRTELVRRRARGCMTQQDQSNDDSLRPRPHDLLQGCVAPRLAPAGCTADPLAAADAGPASLGLRSVHAVRAAHALPARRDVEIPPVASRRSMAGVSSDAMQITINGTPRTFAIPVRCVADVVREL